MPGPPKPPPKAPTTAKAAAKGPKAASKGKPAPTRSAVKAEPADGEEGTGEAIAGFDPDETPTQLVGVDPNGLGWHGPAPKRLADNTIAFSDQPAFRPNLTPKEVLALGSFGGGYFRPIASTVTGKSYNRVWKELPADWLEGLEVRLQVASPTYRKEVNHYKVDCGAKTDKKDAFGLHFWETSGWIAAQDPYGWFMWYCRFYQGRRSADDERQISRWSNAAGPRGRWRQNLVAKCLRDGRPFDDATVSPVVRQTLQHWAYRLTSADFQQSSKRVQRKGAAYVPRAQLQQVIKPPTKAGGRKRSLATADIAEP